LGCFALSELIAEFRAMLEYGSCSFEILVAFVDFSLLWLTKLVAFTVITKLN
jgi:hypothetical protein